MIKICNNYMFLFLLCLVSFPSYAYATVCTKNMADCATMGFTKSAADCSGYDYVIKCPSDATKMSCAKDVKKVKLCDTAGDILYANGMCAANLDELDITLKMVGIVFDPAHRLALALTSVNKEGDETPTSVKIFWSSTHCDIPALENCYAGNYDTCGANGRRNAGVILAGSCAGTPYAANAANNYYPKLCDSNFCQKGKWFLPSAIDVKNIYQNKDSINESLSLLQTKGIKVVLIKKDLWTSTENLDGLSYVLFMPDGHVGSKNKFSWSAEVRPVVRYSVQ